MRSGLFRARALLLQILAALLALLPGLRLVVAEQGGRMHQWKPWMIVTVAEPLGLLQALRHAISGLRNSTSLVLSE